MRSCGQFGQEQGNMHNQGSDQKEQAGARSRNCVFDALLMRMRVIYPLSLRMTNMLDIAQMLPAFRHFHYEQAQDVSCAYCL